MSLELKIPPVILVIIVTVAMIIQTKFSIMPFRSSWIMAGGIIVLGVVIIAMAVWQFNKHKLRSIL